MPVFPSLVRFIGYLLGTGASGAISWPGKNRKLGEKIGVMPNSALRSELAAKSLIENNAFLLNISERRLDLIGKMVGFTVRPLCHSGHSPAPIAGAGTGRPAPRGLYGWTAKTSQSESGRMARTPEELAAIDGRTGVERGPPRRQVAVPAPCGRV